jgi:C-terminal processing protease CtpA/Prc
LVLEKWVNTLGEVRKTEPILPPKDIEYFDENFDLNWINNDKLFSKNLSDKLKFIEDNRFQGNQYYVGFDSFQNTYVRNHNFSKLNYNDRNSRILVLFVYWNVIEYFFPYKYLMDQKWDNALEEMLPVFIQAKNEDDFYTAMQKLTVKLNDSHAVFYRYPTADKVKYYFPAKCKIIDEKMIVTEIFNDDLAKAEDIKIGDVITKVNDKTIKDLVLENRSLINGSNEGAYLNYLTEPILSGFTDNVKLEFLTKEITTTRVVNRYDYQNAFKNKYKAIIKKDKFKILENNIGYVDIGELKIKNIPDMVEKLKSTKAIIFDIRKHPDGTADDISNFLNSKEKYLNRLTLPDSTYIGKFKWTKLHPCGYENKDSYKGKVIILVNEETLSQGEEMAMYFQTADDATIIGSQTAGADGNVSEFILIPAIFTRFSGAGVYYPDGKETQRTGIIPDIKVKPTIKGIQEGKDEILARALLFIETGK